MASVPRRYPRQLILAFISILAVCCSSQSANRRPAPQSVLQQLRALFMHDEVVQLLVSDSTRIQLRTELTKKGYRFDGSAVQSGQEVDAFSTDPLGGPVALHRTMLTLLYAPDAAHLVGVNVLRVSPEAQAQAKALAASSFDSIDAVSTTPLASTGTLHFLGVERLSSSRLLKLMVRVDRITNEVYSIIYVMSAE